MELAEPTIEQAVGRCAAAGAARVIIAPYFLSRGRHIQVCGRVGGWVDASTRAGHLSGRMGRLMSAEMAGAAWVCWLAC